tara:strand:+ start:2032 stop:2907 length:876 start_codon:yes stop_codon:yes gene_type:complete
MKILKSSKGFLGLPKEINHKNKVLVIPFGLEKTVSYESGTRLGPKSIIKASHQVELFDEELKTEPYKKFKIKTLKAVKVKKDLDKALKQLTFIIKKTLNMKFFPLTLGGEHSITPAIINSYKDKYKKLTIIQIDAHADLRNQYLGNKNSHATAMRRCLDNKNVNIIGIGIRNLCKEEFDFVRKNKNKVRIFWAKDISKQSILKIKKLIKNKNVYLTFDVDGFDSSLMPATGTPEPGGLYWNEIIEILKIIFQNCNVVGADVNELAPKPNLHACDFLAAKLVYKILSYKFAN